MAVNPYVNKVIIDGRTVIDLTRDNISPSDVVNGVTFHDKSGASKTGELDLPSGTLQIVENGIKDVTKYASVDVQIPVVVKSCRVELLIHGNSNFTSYYAFTRVNSSGDAYSHVSSLVSYGEVSQVVDSVLCGSSIIVGCSSRNPIYDFSGTTLESVTTVAPNYSILVFKAPVISGSSCRISISETITNNLFNYTFENLNQINLSEGIWNEAESQIEF